ncbi:MAG: 16S rRNA (cytosine(1402)-N(4))-methyltransferase RsmH [Ilumatobacteraceae bacterium]|nr:16S rRNA (cytosine(1402)-N(4))-methyltransferase RsmH [Ilumatobacteraceae bacterium]
MSDFDHVPVMRQEIVDALAPTPPGVMVDATLGGGGHSEAFLEARDDVRILGLDRDQDALDFATRRLEPFGERVMTHRCRFDQLREALDAHDVDGITGALFDLGVSSPQLDRPERGFSYRHDGPLDMRMDGDAPWSADDVVNGYAEADLSRVIHRYGDERFARRIAAAIVAARPIESTTRLAEVITSAIPAPARRTGGHPAKRTFQAIRIEVNGELDALPDALDQAIEALVPGGRLAVLSYHSGEDRIAKERIRAAETGGCECPPELPCVCGAVKTVRIVRGVPKRPGAEEQSRNRRASSARLRVAEKLDTSSESVV